MVLDSKLGNSKITKFIEKMVTRIFLEKISPNIITLIGLGLGLISALCFLVPIFTSGQSGWYLAQENFVQDIKAADFQYAWNQRFEIGHFRSILWTRADFWQILGLIFCLLSFSADIFDGTLARLTKPTKFGGILDIFCDRLVELVLFISIIAYKPEKYLWGGLFSFAAIVLCISIFLLIGAAIPPNQAQKLSESQKVIYYTGGIMERTETFIFIFIMLIFPIFREFLLWLFATLVFITAIQRLLHGYRLLEHLEGANKENEKNLKENGHI